MSGSFDQGRHQQSPDSSMWKEQAPLDSSSADVFSSNFDLSLDTSHHQCRDLNISSNSNHQEKINVNQKYIHNPEVSTNFPPRQPTIFYPKKSMFQLGEEMPLRFSEPVLLPNPHQSPFYHLEQPTLQYRQPQIPCYPQRPTGVSSHPQPRHRHQQPIVAMSYPQPFVAQSHRHPTIAQSHRQPSVAQSHRLPTIAQSHWPPTVEQSYHQSKSFNFQQPQPMLPLYRFPVPHQSHKPVHLNHLQLTPNPFNMFNMPQYYQNLRKRAISDMNYRNLKSRAWGLKEDVSEKSTVNIGPSSYSPVPVIQKVRPPQQNICSKNKALNYDGAINLIPNVNDNDSEVNGSKSGEEFHLIKTGQELARMCFAVEVGCQTDLSLPLDMEIVLMPLETLNDLVTASEEHKSDVEQDESGTKVLLEQVENPKSETSTTMDVTAIDVEIKESFQKSSLVALSVDQLGDSKEDCKNSNPDNLLPENSNQGQEFCSKVDMETDNLNASKEIPSIKENSTEQRRKGIQNPNLISNDSNSHEEENENYCSNTIGNSKSLESIKENENSNENIEDPKSKNEKDSRNGFSSNSDFTYIDNKDKVESFNPLSNFVTLMSYIHPYIEDELSSDMNFHASIPPGAKPFEQHYPIEAHQSDQYNLKKTSYSEQVNSEKASLIDQYNHGKAFYSEQDKQEYAFQSEQYNSGNAFQYEQKNYENAFQSEQNNSENAFQSEQNNSENAFQSEQNNSENAFQSEQYSSENAFQSEQYNSENAFQSEQNSSENALQSEQYNSENAIQSEHYNSENPFQSGQYNSEKTIQSKPYKYEKESYFEQDILKSSLNSKHSNWNSNTNFGKDKLVKHIPEIPCQSTQEPNLGYKKTATGLVCLANGPRTSMAISQEPRNVSSSSHASTVICRNPTQQSKTISLNNGKTNKSLDSSGGLQTDPELKTSKMRCRSESTKSEQNDKLEQPSRRKNKVKNRTGINRKPDIATRMSSDQYEHSKVGNESVKHKPRKLSEDLNKNWNMALLDALNVPQECGYVAGITSLKKEKSQSSVRKQNEGVNQDTTNECSSESQKKRSSRGRLLKKKRFYGYEESSGGSTSHEYKHYREEKSEDFYSPTIETKNSGFPFHSKEKYLKNEHELEGHVENTSPEINAINVVCDSMTVSSPETNDLSAESLVIKMVSQGIFEGNCNSKEYVGETKSSQKRPLMSMSNISSEELGNINALKLDVQFDEKVSDPLKTKEKFKEHSETLEDKVNESAKDEKHKVNIGGLADNELSKNKIMPTKKFPSDGKECQVNKKEDTVHNKINCKMGNRTLRSASKPKYHTNHQEDRKPKGVGKKVTKEESESYMKEKIDKSKEIQKKSKAVGKKITKEELYLKEKLDLSKEMVKKNTSLITKQLQKVFSEVMKDSGSAEFYFGIDEARPMPMYYKIDNLEIDLKSVEMRLENDLYADAEQFLEDFRKIVKISIDYFGPIHKISRRSRKLLDLACRLVSQRNLNLPSCPKFDLMEMLNDKNNHLEIGKRHLRAAKRKTAEKPKNYSSKMSRDESPDHVCEECGTIFAHFRSYTRHCRAKSGCAKALNKAKQMVGHTIQTSQSPPRSFSDESPERVHFNLDDLIDLATAPPGQGDQLLKALDRDIVACKRTVQKNKFLSALRRKAQDRHIEPYRVPSPSTRINPRWTNYELLLATQGVRNFGKNFKAIAQVLGSKTESQVRSFFVNYKRRYNLDNAFKEYISEYAETNNDEVMHVDKNEGSGAAGSSNSNKKPRNETFTCKECNLQFSTEDALDIHIEVDWPECGELFARDKPSGEDETGVSKSDRHGSQPLSTGATSSLRRLSSKKRLPKKSADFIPSVPRQSGRGVPVVSHTRDTIAIDADNDNFEPPGLQIRSFVNVNANI